MLGQSSSPHTAIVPSSTYWTTHGATRLWLSAIIGAAITLGISLGWAGNAWAISAPIQIAGTEGEGVLIHSEPNQASTRLGWIAEGASPEFSCFVHGQTVGTVSVWFYVTHEGITGYYPSFYDNSSYKNDTELTEKYGVPACGATLGTSGVAPAPEAGGSEVPASESPSSPAPLGVNFDRSATVSWATHNAKDTPPHPAACTWFVSQALWAGGLPQTTAWTSSGAHGHPWSRRPGTAAAWAVPSFVEYILGAYPRSTFTEISLSGNKVPAAQPGDVIAYDWYGQSSVHSFKNLRHLSLVTSIVSGEYPDVAEWSIYDGTQPTPYVSRGWTWSQKSHQWLQKEYPKVQAFLLHIDTSQ
jgi:hypothetical protein